MACVQGFKQAIRIARLREGWTWVLFNGDDAPAAAGGAAPALDAAMEIAWRAARSFAPADANLYPEIFVEAAPVSDADAPQRHGRSCRARRAVLELL